VVTLAAGARLADGRFVLARLLGAGGLGQVWLAQDTHSDRRVALKILAPEYARHPGALELLRREFAHQQSVAGHPHILPVHELVDSEAGLLLVMPHATGGDAGQLRGAPWQRLLPVLSQVAAALEHAHARGVVHRDLKCTNVLLDDRGTAQLSDFGHAQVIGAAVEQRSHGGGTPGTMSPQQLEGAAPSPADDIYAYGVLCFELLTGELPFAPAEAASRQRPQQSLAGRVDGLPAALIELVGALLADSPSARPASMSAVGEVLAELQPQRAAADTLRPADRKHPPAAQDAPAHARERQDDEDIAITPLRPRRRRALASDPATGTRAGSGAIRASTAGSPPASTRSRGLPGGPREWSIAAFALLLALLLATVFWLPQLGAPRVPEAPPVVITPPPDADEATPARPAPGEIGRAHV
jgi:serine/threonine protein kinase